MRSVKRSECPNTRAEFITKWETSPIFRARCEAKGFKVVMGNVIFPNGKVASPLVK
jgi:hypothetical protein